MNYPLLYSQFENEVPLDPSLSYDYRQVHLSEKEPQIKKLWLEVLRQALEDYQEYIQKKDNELKEVFNLFFNPSDNIEGSFHWVCDVLDLDKFYILKLLTHWTKSNSSIDKLY